MHTTALAIVCIIYHMTIPGQLLPTNLIKVVSVHRYNMRGNDGFPDLSVLGSFNTTMRDKTVGKTDHSQNMTNEDTARNQDDCRFTVRLVYGEGTSKKQVHSTCFDNKTLGFGRVDCAHKCLYFQPPMTLSPLSQASSLHHDPMARLQV